MISFLLALLFAVAPMSSLELEVREAFDTRDSFCVSMREPAPLMLFAQADVIAMGRVGVLLSNAEAGHNPWFHLMRCLYEERIGSGKEQVFLDNALFLSKQTPGTPVALTLELLRQGRHEMALRAAQAANRAFLERGRRSAYLEGVWIQAASVDTINAVRWQALAREVTLASGTPAGGLFPVLDWPASLLGASLRGDWRATLEMVRQIWCVLRSAMATFLILVLLALGVRHHQAVVHPLRETLSSLPSWVGLVLSWLPLVALLLVGWVMAGWALLLASSPRWRSPAERWCGLAAGLMLVVAPLDAWLGGSFLALDQRTGSFGALVAELDGEGSREDSLAAGAVRAMRQGNPAQASGFLQEALQQDSSGWIADLRAWVALKSKDPEAKALLTAAWERGRNPWTGAALGLAVDTPETLRRQILSNDFGGVPEPTASQAIGLLLSQPITAGARELWTLRSLLPLEIQSGLSVLAMIGLGFLAFSPRREHRGIEACVVCGHTTCPRCRRSSLCPACRTVLAEASHENERRRIRLERVALRVTRRRRFQALGNGLLPGWGSLAAAPGPGRGTILVFSTTCLLLGLGIHGLLWVGDTPGTPTISLRLLACLPAALWTAAILPLFSHLLGKRKA